MFQKSFVEFFVPYSEVQRLEHKLGTSSAKRISMYASNKKVRPLVSYWRSPSSLTERTRETFGRTPIKMLSML